MLRVATMAVLTAACAGIAPAAAQQLPRGWSAVADGELGNAAPADSDPAHLLEIALALSLSPAALRALEQTFEQVRGSV